MTTIREAKTVEDALLVLPVRNEARLFMTRHRDVITEEQQRVWFAKWVQTGDKSLYLVEVLDTEGRVSVVGYGLINWDPHDPDSRYAALTAALLPPFRGVGYGRLVFDFLVSETRIRKKIPWLEVLSSNASARGLYRKLGFVETSRATVGAAEIGTEVITMIHTR